MENNIPQQVFIYPVQSYEIVLFLLDIKNRLNSWWKNTIYDIKWAFSSPLEAIGNSKYLLAMIINKPVIVI